MNLKGLEDEIEVFRNTFRASSSLLERRLRNAERINHRIVKQSIDDCLSALNVLNSAVVELSHYSNKKEDWL